LERQGLFAGPTEINWLDQKLDQFRDGGMSEHLENREPFEVEVVLVRGREVNLYVFKEPCPQCGYCHTHGAGRPGVDEPQALAGHRIRHCPDRNRRGKLLDYSALRDYVLVWRGLEQTREEMELR